MERWIRNRAFHRTTSVCLFLSLLVVLLLGATSLVYATDDVDSTGPPTSELSSLMVIEPMAATSNTTIDNGDGSYTFVQVVDENSTTPHYSTPASGGGFGIYSYFSEDYGWMHDFDQWNATGLSITSATMKIVAWDIDSETYHGLNGEYDSVNVDGAMLSPGYLQGNDATWSNTTFDIPLGAITDDGDINVWLDIDMNHTYNYWATTLDYSELRITYRLDGNLPPYQPQLTISPTGAVTGVQDIVVTVIGPTPADPDLDGVTYTYRWFVDVGTGSFVDDEFAGKPNHTGNTVPAADTVAGEIWQVQVTPVDEHGAIGPYATIQTGTATQLTVSFDPNGGDNTPPDKTVTVGSAYGTLGSAGSNPGYTFAGWFTDATGGTEVTESTIVTVSANHTLYAHWTLADYNVYYNANGGAGAQTDSTIYHMGDPVTVKDAGTITRTGFFFAGWNTAANGSGTAYAADDTFNMPAGNITLYAQWEQAFRIQLGKYNDEDNSGDWSPGETDLAGISFELYDASKSLLGTYTTAWLVDRNQIIINGLTAGTYYLKELGPWTLTGVWRVSQTKTQLSADADGMVKIDINATTTNAPGESTQYQRDFRIRFYNSDDGWVKIKKFYDVDKDGIWDPEDRQIWWKIKLVKVVGSTETVIFNDAERTLGEQNAWIELDAGTYRVYESMPVGTEPFWGRTTPDNPIEFTVVPGEKCNSYIFGNGVCYGSKTIGFWGNKNGKKEIDKIAGVWTQLSALNLKNADGSNFDPASFAQFNSWLQAANAENMQYMLSAQLAAAELNVLSGYVAPTVMLVVDPAIDADGLISVGDLIAAANNALATLDPVADKGLLGKYKNALDMFNNDWGYALPAYSF
ncbi:MAG: InlB B-repeat-containing protein [Syntrophomonadaceae bacterium]